MKIYGVDLDAYMCKILEYRAMQGKKVVTYVEEFHFKDKYILIYPPVVWSPEALGCCK